MKFSIQQDVGMLENIDALTTSLDPKIRANDYNFDQHPAFEVFASGVMASENTPDFVRHDEELRRRYPSRPLAGLNAGNCWEPTTKQGWTRTS